MTLRIALGSVGSYDDNVAAFAHQLGLGSILLHNPENLDQQAAHWSYGELAALRDRILADGLDVEGIENVPAAQISKIHRGVAGRDEQIEHYCTTIRNMARAGYTLLGHHFMPTSVWRTERAALGRGGAHVTAFDLGRVDEVDVHEIYRQGGVGVIEDPIDAEQMWANYRYFLEAVLPVAEEHGIRLALHPDDPPVDELDGVARIFTQPEALIKARDYAGHSDAWGLEFCMGTVSEMGGESAVNAVIDGLGATGDIAYVHFRDVVGTVPTFREGFLGEGNYDPARVLRRLCGAGFEGFLIDDHVPAMLGDQAPWEDTRSAAYCSRGRAHAIGYLQGLLDAVTH